MSVHPPASIPIPPEAFTKPTPDELSANQAYWTGYASGASESSILPSPAGSKNYETYRMWCDAFLLPPASGGFPNHEAVGYNNAMIDGLNWLWTNDPASPHNVVSA
jgi:hypothetical protein